MKVLFLAAATLLTVVLACGESPKDDVTNPATKLTVLQMIGGSMNGGGGCGNTLLYKGGSAVTVEHACASQTDSANSTYQKTLPEAQSEDAASALKLVDGAKLADEYVGDPAASMLDGENHVFTFKFRDGSTKEVRIDVNDAADLPTMLQKICTLVRDKTISD